MLRCFPAAVVANQLDDLTAIGRFNLIDAHQFEAVGGMSITAVETACRIDLDEALRAPPPVCRRGAIGLSATDACRQALGP
jgi:hypothetical protein